MRRKLLQAESLTDRERSRLTTLVKKYGRPAIHNAVDSVQCRSEGRPVGTTKRDPEYRDFEDMQFAAYVDGRIAQLTEQTGKAVSPEAVFEDHICKEFKRGPHSLMKYYRRGKRHLDACRAIGITFAFSPDRPDILKKISRTFARTLTK